MSAKSGLKNAEEALQWAITLRDWDDVKHWAERIKFWEKAVEEDKEK